MSNAPVPKPRTMLVTGAGGFLGGRVIEMAHLRGFANVRAGLKRWDSAARVARFGVDTQLCDVLNREQLVKNIKGMDVIVHCAAGGRDVTVDGTSNALDAAFKCGVKRFIYISTAEVYGNVSGVVDEKFPYRSLKSEYSDAKIEAEKLCTEYQSKGLPVVILRPSLIYGPFGNEYVVRTAERLYAGGLGEMETIATGFCNIAYVDDVVDSIFLSIGSNDAVGQAFNVNGPEKVTWNDYFRLFAEALSITDFKHLSGMKAKAKSSILDLIAPTATYVGVHYGSFVLRTGRKLRIGKRVEGVRSFLHTTPRSWELSLMGRTAYYSYQKASTILGYSPRFNLRTGLQLTVSWLSHEGHLQRIDPNMRL